MKKAHVKHARRINHLTGVKHVHRYCTICGSSHNSVPFGEGYICEECIDYISKL